MKTFGRIKKTPTFSFGADQISQEEIDTAGVEKLRYFSGWNIFNHTHQSPRKKKKRNGNKIFYADKNRQKSSCDFPAGPFIYWM